MADEKFYVTEEGLQELKNEFDHLLHVTRAEVIEDLKAARAQGDLSENADYDAARDRQAQVEARIKELEKMISNAEIIKDNKASAYVRVGSRVEIEELDTHNICTYSICEVDVDKPYEVKILSVK